jgi:hypothetical protein
VTITSNPLTHATIMRLDSGPFMTSAHRLYEAEGFRDRPIYEGVEVTSELHHNWRFMEFSLRLR